MELYGNRDPQIPSSNRDDASPLWAILPAEMREGFDNTIAIAVPGEHTNTRESPKKEALMIDSAVD